MTNGRRIRVRGQVQGVGFRPFVWQLANRMGLTGEVLNDAEGVLIFASGEDLDGFEAAIVADAPALASVDRVKSEPADVAPTGRFVIAASGGSGAETRVTPDAATCGDCIAEINDPAARRNGYAFTNCTNCGPRFTILRSLPYDRATTTMAPFEMCPKCRAEYEDPADRRFHAQPVACPECGPRVWAEADGETILVDPIGTAANWLTAGRIVAIKGLGGFHLACDATDESAVARLRARKRRPSKPFALMAPMEVIRAHADISDDDADLLTSPAAPIVLLAKAGETLPEALAPGQNTLGWMLPYTPLHHLLLARVGRALVMTSGNLSGEPQVIGNDEARRKLGPFVDGYLMHDRDIARRLDDSVERNGPAGPMVLRRARGRVPGTLPVPEGFDHAAQAVAYGGQMKSAICLVKDGNALLGHHLGELDEALTWEAFLDADRDYAALFDHRPDAVAVDLHPQFHATRHGRAKAQDSGLRLIEVQHHHAHMAACMADNLWPLDGGPVAGIILDGLGLGPDGTVWGGEVLLGGYADFERRAWLKPAPLVGGDLAQAQPWRNALVRLDQAGLRDWADRLFPDAPRDIVRRAAASGLNAPMSSSAGRLFDAVAACLGICPGQQSFEGEAAMLLEAVAEAGDRAGFEFADEGPMLDPAPVFATIREALARGDSRGRISAQVHAGIAHAFASRAQALVAAGEAQAVALSGGCFQNVRLLEETQRCLEGVRVLVHKTAPANDGGLALGQAMVALARMETK